jgi:hypothetical protein
MRPAVMVFLHDSAKMIKSTPSLTQPARVPFEAGRIEFKAFDTCNDVTLYHQLFMLLIGIILDTKLPQRAVVPDIALHQRAARFGFSDAVIQDGARTLLQHARTALIGTFDSHMLDPLEAMIENNSLPVHALIKTYRETNNILTTLQHYANLNV